MINNARKDAEALREILVDDCIDFPRVVHTMLHKAADLIESLAAELEQVTQERDAAVEDIPRACGYCKYYDENTDQCTNSLPCACVSGVNTRWQWRGVKED